MTQWFEAKLNRFVDLNDVEAKGEILAEIRIKLGSLNNVELEQISRSLNYGLLFSLLTPSDREYTEQVCNILKILFGNLVPGEIYQRYSVEISQLIVHPDATVRAFFLHQILVMVSNPQGLSQFVADIGLLSIVANCIGDTDIAVAKCAIDIMKEIGKDAHAIHIAYSSAGGNKMPQTFARLLDAKDAVVSFRVYEVVVHMANSSREGLDTFEHSGFLNSLMDLLESDDILLQLNTLEVMTQLASTAAGLSYLERKDVLTKLMQKIAQADENPLSNLLVPGLMKFFGNVAKYWPNEIFSKYPAVVSALFEVIENGEPLILGAALDTLGHVASSTDGKYALELLRDSMTGALKVLAEVIQKMPTELRIRGLNNLALILDVKKPTQDNRILLLTKSWFDALSEDSMGMILTLCMQPFADVRQASLEVLKVVSSQTWGQKYMSSYPGLVEFLLDRNSESFKECKDVKYEIVKELSESEQDIFDAETIQKLKGFVIEGPHFVDTNIEVAIEGAS